MNLVKVSDSDTLKKYGIYNSPQVLRKWHSTKKNLFMFLKINNRLYIDIEAWENHLSQKRRERTLKIKELQKMGIGRDN